MVVKDIMTKDVIAATPDQPLKEIAQLLKEKRISGLPVVSRTGEIIGIITMKDMLKILDRIYRWKIVQKKFPDVSFSEISEQEKTNSKVRDVMTEQVFTLTENQPLDSVMEMMFERGLHTIPVVDTLGKLVGIVDKRDLINACF